MGTMTAMVAHEFNNKLTAIIEAAALACPMPVVTWHTASALQCTAGASAGRPGTRISRVAPSATSHGAASKPKALMTITRTGSGRSATAGSDAASVRPQRHSSSAVSVSLPRHSAIATSRCLVELAIADLEGGSPDHKR